MLVLFEAEQMDRSLHVIVNHISSSIWKILYEKKRIEHLERPGGNEFSESGGCADTGFSTMYDERYFNAFGMEIIGWKSKNLKQSVLAMTHVDLTPQH